MRFLVLMIAGFVFSTSSDAAPTAYELGDGLVTIMNANNEMDGPFQFLVCQTPGSVSYSAEEKNVSEYLVMRKGGESDKIFQVKYSVVTIFANVVQSITRLNTQFVDNLACPEGSFQVYTATKN